MFITLHYFPVDMDNIELEMQNEFLDFVNKKVEEKFGKGTGLTLEDISIRVWKHAGTVRDADNFHKTAQAFGVTELAYGAGGLFYDVMYQREGDYPETEWSIGLADSEECRRFREIYGGDYAVRRIM